jgi:hypothetical protein
MAIPNEYAEVGIVWDKIPLLTTGSILNQVTHVILRCETIVGTRTWRGAWINVRLDILRTRFTVNFFAYSKIFVWQEHFNMINQKIATTPEYVFSLAKASTIVPATTPVPPSIGLRHDPNVKWFSGRPPRTYPLIQP